MYEIKEDTVYKGGKPLGVFIPQSDEHAEEFLEIIRKGIEAKPAPPVPPAPRKMPEHTVKINYVPGPFVTALLWSIVIYLGFLIFGFDVNLLNWIAPAKVTWLVLSIVITVVYEHWE